MIHEKTLFLILAGSALHQSIIFGKMHFLLISERAFSWNKTWRIYKFVWNSCKTIFASCKNKNKLVEGFYEIHETWHCHVYFMKYLFTDISKKCISPSKFEALIIFGKMHFLGISESNFFHETNVPEWQVSWISWFLQYR